MENITVTIPEKMINRLNAALGDEIEPIANEKDVLMAIDIILEENGF